jgi:hypothetical protein
LEFGLVFVVVRVESMLGDTASVNHARAPMSARTSGVHRLRIGEQDGSAGLAQRAIVSSNVSPPKPFA